MFDVTSFNKERVYVVLAVLSFCAAVIITSAHHLLPFDAGDHFEFVLVFALFFACSIAFLKFLQWKFRKHANIIRDVLDNVGDVIVVKDFDGKFIYCNQVVADLYASTPEAMVGKDDFDFTGNKEQADFFRDNVRSIMQRFEKEDVYESSTDAETGEVRHFHSIKIPFRDARGQLRIAVIAKDITEISRLKEDADKNKKRLEHVLDVSEEGLWEWNVQTNEVLHNRQWEVITGIEQSEETFKEFENCIQPEDRPKVHKALEHLLTRNEPYSIEFRMKRADGKDIWVWDRGRVAEYDENGQPVWIVGIVQDITSKKLNQLKVANLAYFDQLTGLINRARMEVELEEAIEYNQEHGTYSAILFLDLDRFKLLNDSYGHHMGDRLLQLIALRLKEANHEGAKISRFGGDEFVFILTLPEPDQAKATQVATEYANKILQVISAPLHLTNEIQQVEIEYAITGSVGGVVFQSRDVSADELLQRADMVLYRAKAQGGHCALVFDTSMQSDLKYASNLQKNMRDSIANRDFCIFLQPKYVDPETLMGAEALVRWQHPELGLLSPAAFIDMAEESNLIIPIGEQVLGMACAQLKLWQMDPATAHLTLSVNLSAKQLWQSDFVDGFIAIIEAAQIDHTKLIVEVTESVLIQDVNDATDKLTHLKAYGLSISLDDFGTGYSSLGYLRSLPIDEIKIDQMFIHDLSKDKQALLMVKSIIGLAKMFDLRVISEGVEELDQLEFLQQHEVSGYQGYYFSPPLPQDEFSKLIG